MGEFDKIIISADGISDVVANEIPKSLEIPAKGISELDRLSHLVNSVETDC